MNIKSLLYSIMPACIFATLILTSVSAWADEDGLNPEDAKRPVTEHPDPEQVNTTGDWEGNVDAKKKPKYKHKNTEEVNTTGEWKGDVTAPNKSAPQRLVGSEEDEFKVLDINNNGLIEEDERVGDAGMTRNMSMIDGNGDGSIDKREYRAYYNMRYGTQPLTHLNNSDPEERAMRFKKLDKDGNGELSAAEFDSANM